MAKPSGSTEGLTRRTTLQRRRARTTLDEIFDARVELEVARRELDRSRKLLLRVGEDPDEGVVARETEAADPEATPDLTEEEWLQAELIVLGTEAKALAASLTATRDVVEARCDLLLAGDGR